MSGTDSVRPRIDMASVVLLGSFNPAIFQPAWLKQVKLLNDAEADGANVEVVHRSITVFSTEWLKLTVTLERFEAHTSSPTHSEAVRDLTMGAFQLLEHTPVTAMGVNRLMHFEIDSEDRWHALGDRLAPKDLWVQKLTGQGSRATPGLRSMTIEGQCPEETGSTWRVTVEPSQQVHPGLFVGCNEHWKAEDAGGLSGLMEKLGSSWDQSREYALEIARTIMEKG